MRLLMLCLCCLLLSSCSSDSDTRTVDSLVDTSKVASIMPTEGKSEGLIKMESYLSQFSEKDQELIGLNINLTSQEGSDIVVTPSLSLRFDPDYYIEGQTTKSQIIHLVNCDGNLLVTLDTTLDEGSYDFLLYDPQGELQWKKTIEEGSYSLDKTFHGPILGKWYLEVIVDQNTQGNFKLAFGNDVT